ncbi:MAG: antitoxin (DNA-binding transcriptional repressor) of toxin-antitoxin stability system [Polaribacter sp.]|jgi:antitoxin (DNA-binding transcriptional repressor) of toxin-antitoxin stability system
MEISASQLQTKHRFLVDALHRGEEVTITYHGKAIGITKPLLDKKLIEEPGADDFFGMHKTSIDSVEEELRAIRVGSRNQIDEQKK